MDWRQAYFKQAWSDYDLFKMLNSPHNQSPFCQRLHYLQMTTEKLAKGFSTPPNGDPPPRVHHAFVGFLQSVKRTPQLRRVEELAPVGDRDKPNPEYPWQETTLAGTTIIAPVDFDFRDLDFKNPKMIKLLDLIDRCFQII